MSVMLDAISEPRDGLSEFAPRVLSLQIPVDKIRDVIGPGGKVIRSIIDETGADIDVNDDGMVYVASRGEGAELAVERIKLLTKDVEIGEKYKGSVVSIQPFGAFVQLIPGKDGLLHISRVAKGRVDKVEDVLSEGDEIEVEVLDIDDRGKVSLDWPDKPDVTSSGGSGGGGGDSRGGSRDKSGPSDSKGGDADRRRRRRR
jgi:polyribonucleotide nucleotidyltransferase